MRVRGHGRAREAGASSGHEEGDAQVDERETGQGAQDEAAADQARLGFGHRAVRGGRSCRSGFRSGQCALLSGGLTITAPPLTPQSESGERRARGGEAANVRPPKPIPVNVSPS